MNPDFDRAERHARSLDGEDDSVRHAAETAPPGDEAPASGLEKATRVIRDHPVAGAVGALTGATTGTLVAGPAGAVVGAATGAARGVVAAAAVDEIRNKLDNGGLEQDPSEGA